MGNAIRRLRPSPALVVASLALALSLGGVGYAAIKLPRNSVGALQLRNNSVSSSKIKNHTLKSVDFARGVVRQGARGSTGARGPAGNPGPAGPPGPAGVGIGGSCSGGSAIRAVATTGSVSCQPQATDSADGYLSAADHASFAAPATFAFSSPLNANATLSTTGFYFTFQTFTFPSSPRLHQLAVTWNAEWNGGTASTPKTLTCQLRVDSNTVIAQRHSTNHGGYSNIAMSALANISSGSHTIGSWCEVDVPPASLGDANAVMIGTD